MALINVCRISSAETGRLQDEKNNSASLKKSELPDWQYCFLAAHLLPGAAGMRKQGSSRSRRKNHRKIRSPRTAQRLPVRTTQGIVTEEQAREQGQGILTMQVTSAGDYITNSVAGFNRQSDNYYILIQEIGFGESLRICRERTIAELIAGRGPDIFEGDTFPTINESVLEKGILMDLAPLLDTLEITDEKYFPAVRALTFGEHVYGFCTSVKPDGYWMLESVLGGRDQPDIETLVDRLYSYPDQKAVWRQYAPYYMIPDYLLGGSEDMWGMIDREAGRCDFSGDLFAKILEITKRYGDPEGKGHTGLSV